MTPTRYFTILFFLFSLSAATVAVAGDSFVFHKGNNKVIKGDSAQMTNIEKKEKVDEAAIADIVYKKVMEEINKTITKNSTTTAVDDIADIVYKKIIAKVTEQIEKTVADAVKSTEKKVDKIIELTETVTETDGSGSSVEKVLLYIYIIATFLIAAVAFLLWREIRRKK